ncbi:MAG: hypothetical protein IJC11_02660 [Alphaproteobacteria bacterium]|nr:hypothetical protein [Alphaproteobacteria bacterium]
MSINNKEFSEFTKLKPELTYTWVANKKTNQDRRYVVYSFEPSEYCSLDLSTPEQCQKFAQYIGSYASDTLKHIRGRLVEKENINTAIIQQIDGTLRTIDRKIDKHVAEMVKTVQNMTLDVSFAHLAEKAGFNTQAEQESLKQTLVRIAWVHDIGRLGEIGLGNTTKTNVSDTQGIAHFNAQNIVAKASATPDNLKLIEANLENKIKIAQTGENHAFISAHILEKAGISDPLFLLSVKYHGVNNLKTELEKDTLYTSLSETDKQKAFFACEVTRDADKISNLKVKAYLGMQDAGEPNNPDFHGDCDLTATVLQDYFSKRTVNTKSSKTYLDTLLKFASWAYDLNLDVSKNEFKNNYVQPLFETMRRQALTEKQGIQTGVSPALPQSEEKYQAALNIIQVAEEYMNAALSSQEYDINLSELMSENHLAIISSSAEND